jgi:hypothetical protein
MDRQIQLPPPAARSAFNDPNDTPPNTIGAPRSAGGRAWLQARVFNRLALVRGAVVTLQDLIEAAYGDQLDGGPLRAKNNVRVTMFRLRRRGIKIRICRGRGYVLL